MLFEVIVQSIALKLTNVIPEQPENELYAIEVIVEGMETDVISLQFLKVLLFTEVTV